MFCWGRGGDCGGGGGSGGGGVTAVQILLKNGAVQCLWSLVRQDAAVSLEPDFGQPTLTMSFLYQCFVFFPAYYYSMYSNNLLMLL